MMPENTLSTVGVATGFLTPSRYDSLIDYEWGGVDFYNTSQGLKRSLWSSKYVDGKIILHTGSIEHIVLTVANVTAISFAFDFNMRPTITYVVNNSDVFFYWYNSSTQQQETRNYGSEYKTPQLALDDHRETQSANADIIFAYVRDGVLRSRIQRDRYDIEYSYGDSEELAQIGMMRNNRFGFVSKAINVYSYLNDLAFISTRNNGSSNLNFLDLDFESPQGVSFGNNVLVSSGSEFNEFSKGKKNIVNNVSVSLLIDDIDYDYFMKFYRVWQHDLKPFYANLVLDNRKPERYKCHFVPDSVSMATVGTVFRISASLSVVDKRANNTGYKALARSRND